MMKRFVLATVAVSLGLIGISTAEAHSKRHVRHVRPWCSTHYCAHPHALYPVRRHYPILDGTEPLCGFNDGTYMRNALECGFR
jgi:hypothetical protein